VITTEEFVEICKQKYRWEPLPVGERWEIAHHPLPRCLGGEETVELWSSDHHIHGVLQSIECNHKCFFSTTLPYLVGEWEWLVPYFNYYNTKHITLEVRQKAAKEMHKKITKEQRSKAGKIGGPKGGRYRRTPENIENLKKALDTPKIKQQRSRQVTLTNKRKMRCTVTGYINNPGNVGKHQKRLGIDPSNREWVDDLTT
jgi:hypothetical protein